MRPWGDLESCWDVISLDDVSAAVRATSIALVELSAPAALFNRLLNPARYALAARFDGRLALFRCTVTGAEPQCAEWRITGLPGFVLFRQGHPARRWLGEVHSTLLIRGIEVALEAMAPTPGHAP